MEGSQAVSRLTPREREIARLIGLGYTNRQIGVELSIKERTASAHVQNILNKLGANNRAQIAAWSALDSAKSPRVVTDERAGGEVPASPHTVVARSVAQSRRGFGWITALVAALVVLVAATDDGERATFASSSDVLQVPGSLAYEASFRGDGEGFGSRYVIGDPSASEIRFTNSSVEFAVLKPGGDTGNNLAMEAMERYYVEARLSVEPGSNVEFWINLGSNGYATHIGDHLLDLQTASQLLQLQYLNFVDNKGGLPLGPQIPVPGLQAGRTFTLAAIVDPPNYQIFLDGRRVVNLSHAPSAAFQQISFAIFGEGGTVRLTSIRVYRVT